jgi:pimeloyl-ACP methyl ester carboxylesterase
MSKKVISMLNMALLPMAINGCATPKPTPEQTQAGAVWMFPGIFGGDWSLAEARRGFRDGGVDRAIYSFDWERLALIDFFPNLMDEPGNRERAGRCAEAIVEYAQNYPDRPISLVGYSGGAGVAVMVAEALPAEVHLHNVLLVHGAISPDYDLTAALQRIDGKLVNFYSSLDWLMLGVGTSIFGTADRRHTDAAGKVGFELDKVAPDMRDREKVEQVPWQFAQFKNWHFGNHLNMIVYDWNKNVVAPYLKIPKASTDPLRP